MALASGGRLALGRRFASAERRSRESQLLLNRRCERVRTTEHAPRRPRRLLERIHGLAEIVKCGLVVVVELSPAPRRRSVDSRQRFETTRPSSRRLRALRRRPRHGPHHHRSPRARLSTATAHTGSEASCALFDRFVRARAGVATLRTHWQCSCFWATRPPFAHARGNDSLRMAAARASSSFQTSRQQLSWLNSLFAVTESCAQ